MNQTRQPPLLHALILLLTIACGGQAGTDLQGDSEAFCSVSADGPEPVVVGDAYVSDGSSLELGSQDKAFWVAKEGSAPVYVPTAYGSYQHNNYRCGGDLAAWDGNCVIPQNRKMRIDINAASCEAVSQTWSWVTVDAVVEWQEYMRGFHGWDVTLGVPSAQHQPNVLFRCGAITTTNLGETRRVVETCWNLPGYPKDLCFGAQAGRTGGYGIEIIMDLRDMLDASSIPSEWPNIIRNLVWHELGHAAGLGHPPGNDGTRVMNTTLSAQMKAGFMSYHSTWERPAFSNFSRTGNPCNWQPGDAVGDSCPSQ